MKKIKIAVFALVTISIVSIIAAIYFANELNKEKQLNYAMEQTTINNYQVSFANAAHRTELNNKTPSDLLHTIKELNSSMQYYKSVSNTSQNMEYTLVIESYISALEDCLLDNAHGETTDFAHNINNIYSDLIIIGDWLRKRNESDTLIAHNDDDFYEVYLELSSEVIDDIGVYVE